MDNEPESECPICFEGYNISFVGVCGHEFCKDCCKNKDAFKNGCPMCRNDFRPYISEKSTIYLMESDSEEVFDLVMQWEAKFVDFLNKHFDVFIRYIRRMDADKSKEYVATQFLATLPDKFKMMLAVENCQSERLKFRQSYNTNIWYYIEIDRIFTKLLEEIGIYQEIKEQFETIELFREKRMTKIKPIGIDALATIIETTDGKRVNIIQYGILNGTFKVGTRYALNIELFVKSYATIVVGAQKGVSDFYNLYDELCDYPEIFKKACERYGYEGLTLKEAANKVYENIKPISDLTTNGLYNECQKIRSIFIIPRIVDYLINNSKIKIDDRRRYQNYCPVYII